MDFTIQKTFKSSLNSRKNQKMSVSELKKRFHDLIEKIDNKHLLKASLGNWNTTFLLNPECFGVA